LAYKHYKSLKFLLKHNDLFTEEFKSKIIRLINENKKYKYLSVKNDNLLSDESLTIEGEIDDLFEPYITDNDFAEWRGDYLY
jgi:hypothetical protein